MKACVDFGHNSIKATSEFKESIMFPSLVSQDVKDVDLLGLSDYDPLDYLRVKYGHEEYFIGELARQQSNLVTQTISDDDIISEEAELLVKTAVGHLYNPAKTEDNNIQLLVTIPVSHFVEYREKFKEMFKNEQVEIEFFNHANKEYKAKKTFYFDKVEVRPQGFCALMDEVLDKKGKIKESKQKFAAGYIAVVDIGYYSTDIFLAKKLKPLNYVPESPIPGMVTGYRMLAKQISEQFGVRKKLYELQENFESGKISIKGETYNLKPYLKIVYERLTNNIVAEMNNLIPNIKEIDKFLLAGGGAIPLQKKFHDHFDNIKIANQPQFSNAEGGLKWATRKL